MGTPLICTHVAVFYYRASDGKHMAYCLKCKGISDWWNTKLVAQTNILPPKEKT